MSISATDEKENINRFTRHINKTLIAYTAVTAFCIAFSAVYQSASHGVTSPYMTFLFAFPAAGGVLPFLIIKIISKKIKLKPHRLSYNLWNAAVAAATLGSAVRGALEIYGTESIFIPLYFVVAALLAAAAFITAAGRA